MLISKGTNTLILRYGKYNGISLVEELEKEIVKSGSCWMLKLGRKIHSVKLRHIVEDGHFIFLKSPKVDGDKYHIAIIEESYEGKPTENMNYPEYYSELGDYAESFSLDGTWIKIGKIIEVPTEVVERFFVESSGNKATEVISQTRTSVLFVVNKTEIIINGV